MTAPRVETLPAARSKIYLRRAENLLKLLEVADDSGNSDGLATAAIQATISLADAFTVTLRQRRSRGQDHSEVLLLIRECPSPSTPEVVRLVQRILSRRSEALYGSEEVSLRQARELATLARKLDSIIRSALTQYSASPARNTDRL